MRAVKRLMIGLVLVLFLGLSGCGGKTADPPPPDQQDNFAIDSAKKQESGAKLKPGESKEVITPFEPVIVTKDQSGTVTYKVKGK